MNKGVRMDFFVVVAIIFVSVPLILFFEVRPLVSAIFFFALPSVYLFFRKKKPIKELCAGSLLIGVGFGFIFDVLASANNVWNELGSQLVFDYRIFGFLPADEPIWFVLWVLFVLVFYEHFYERHRVDRLSKRFLYIFIPVMGMLCATILVAIFDRERLLFPYAYFLLGLSALIPVLYVLKSWPHLIPKFVKTSIFFFFLYLIYELTAVHLGQWYFPGEYIGWVRIEGIEFPLEELLFWMGASTLVVLSLYEGLVDDRK